MVLEAISNPNDAMNLWFFVTVQNMRKWHLFCLFFKNFHKFQNEVCMNKV